MIKPQFFDRQSALPDGTTIIDTVESNLREWFFIDHPQFKKTMPAAQSALAIFLQTHRDTPTVWVYYPWKQLAVHCLAEEWYFKLRTARNRNIITAEEQQQYHQAVVGVAGLSVGSGIIQALALSGGPKTLRFSDPDTIEVSNLNRLQAKLTDVGTNKAVVAARNVWELDPFFDIDAWEEGLTNDNLERFIAGPQPLQIFIDEMDNLSMKITARLFCRQRGIPVLMATDNGDNVILDVERYDQEPARKIFHGLVAADIDENNALSYNEISFEKWLSLATKIVGPEFLTSRMRASLQAIGQSIAAVPQLGPSAMVAGTSVAYAVRQLLTGPGLPSGRYLIDLEQALAISRI